MLIEILLQLVNTLKAGKNNKKKQAMILAIHELLIWFPLANHVHHIVRREKCVIESKRSCTEKTLTF